MNSPQMKPVDLLRTAILVTLRKLWNHDSVATNLSFKFGQRLVQKVIIFEDIQQIKVVSGSRQNVVSNPLTVISTINLIDSFNQPLQIDATILQSPTIRFTNNMATLERHATKGFISRDDYVRFHLRYYRRVELRTFHWMAIAEIERDFSNKDLSHSYQFSATTESSINCYWHRYEIVFVIWRERPSHEPLIWHLISCKIASDNIITQSRIWFLRTVQDPRVRRGRLPIYGR